VCACLRNEPLQNERECSEMSRPRRESLPPSGLTVCRNPAPDGMNAFCRPVCRAPQAAFGLATSQRCRAEGVKCRPDDAECARARQAQRGEWKRVLPAPARVVA